MQLIHLCSTLLRTATYHHQAALLELEFIGGSRYHYSGVPQQIFDGLLRAPSKGAFFNSQIRNQFPFTQLRPAQLPPIS